MQSQRGYWLPAGFLLAAWLLITPFKTEAGRVGCDTVISEVHKETRTIKQANVDLSKVARNLGTTIAWTEHCMRVYGRRPKRPGLESAESREAELESFEDEEPEETMPEDTEEEGAPDLKIHPERQRLLKIHPVPTPRPGMEGEEGYREGYGDR
jgi:hypothetical protein